MSLVPNQTTIGPGGGEIYAVYLGRDRFFTFVNGVGKSVDLFARRGEWDKITCDFDEAQRRFTAAQTNRRFGGAKIIIVKAITLEEVTGAEILKLKIESALAKLTTEDKNVLGL